MRIWQTITQSPWPLRIIYFVLALYLAFWLIAVLVWFEFGRDAEHQVVDLGCDLTTMVGICVFPLLFIGLIAAQPPWSFGQIGSDGRMSFPTSWAILALLYIEINVCGRNREFSISLSLGPVQTLWIVLRECDR